MCAPTLRFVAQATALMAPERRPLALSRWAAAVGWVQELRVTVLRARFLQAEAQQPDLPTEEPSGYSPLGPVMSALWVGAWLGQQQLGQLLLGQLLLEQRRLQRPWDGG